MGSGREATATDQRIRAEFAYTRSMPEAADASVGYMAVCQTDRDVFATSGFFATKIA